MNAAAVTFAAVFAALYAAHSFGDHWVQTHRQALGKGAPGWAGRVWCARHVITLTITKLVALLALTAVTGLDIHPAWLAAGLLVDAVSHYWADRAARWEDRPDDTLVTLEWLAKKLRKHGFYKLGAGHLGSGAYALDQSFHVAWLFVTALIIAVGAR
ncbi:transcriptional regulator [Nonomuraea pusilla]|uniref:transcriptional regulator n=1 Tax=Nonomuraea pusilla TaxID=46177 RepID=UPI0033217875